MIADIVLANVSHRPVRTGPSILRVAVSVTLILTLVGSGSGFVEDSSRRSRGVGADIIIRPPDSSLMALTANSMPEKIVARLEQLPHVRVGMGVANQSIVGPSGSGKSTLFHVVGGLTPPTGGTVSVGGQNLARLTDEGRTRLRRDVVSFVFQKFNLLPNLSAGQNIQLARYLGQKGGGQNADFAAQLEVLGIAERLRHKPAELSGGERQRVAIGRAIVSRPETWIPPNARKVLEILRELE